MTDKPLHPDSPFTVDSILRQSEPVVAMFKSLGGAAASLHKEMLEGGIAEDVADDIVKDTLHQFVQGTFNKQEFPQIPGLG